jgi:hypothetical protein
MQPPSIEMSVTPDLAQEVLHVELTNRSAQPLTLYDHSLPWVGLTSVILLAARADALGTLLAKDEMIDDPGPGTVTLQPAQTLRGAIALGSRFPEFSAARRERDIIVFWSYRVAAVDGVLGARVGGYELFPRTGEPASGSTGDQ